MNAGKRILPLVFTFTVLSALLTVFRSFFDKIGFDTNFLIIANLFFFLLSLAAFFLQRKGLQAANANVFVRRVYSAILLKLFICIIAFTVYAFLKTKNINKSAIFFAMGFYIIYTSIEVAALLKIARRKNNV